MRGVDATAGESEGQTDGSPRTDGGSERVLPRLGSGEGILAAAFETVGGTQLSGVVGALVAILAAALAGGQLLGSRLTVASLLAGGLLAAGLYGLRSDRVAVLFAAGALLTPAAVAFAVALGVGLAFGLDVGRPVGHLAALIVVLLAGTGFGAVLTAVPLREGAILAGSLMRFVGMLVPLTVAQVLVVAVAAKESVVVVLARLVVDSPDPLLALGRALLAPSGGTALLTFLLYVVLVLYLFRLVLRSIPVATLFPPRQRPMVTARLDRVGTRLGRLLLGVTAAAVCLYVAAAVAGVHAPAALAGVLGDAVGGPLVWLLTTLWVRTLFVIAIGTMGAVVVAERLRRRVRRLSEADLLRQGMPPLGAFVVALVLGLGLDLLVSADELLATAPPTVRPAAESLLAGGVVTAVLVVAFAALILAGLTFVALAVLVSSPVLPERALGPTLSSAAAFGLAMLVVLFGGSSLVAFVVVAAAVVVWDAGEFATGLREELPAGAASTRGELVHVGGSLAVALLAVVGALVLALLIASEAIVPAASDAALAAGAVTVAFGTTLLLLSSLRE
ncbi:DUF7519 family protein [Halorientalis halophila]|uniref:DUF7519 family protein n=1 Tax=Halorientalis halophila TaxID=3108499 RepID=UPI0030089BBA